MAKKLTQEEFISKAIAIHSDKYNYSKVEYVNSQTKVCIICPIHGEFWQRPSLHLRGKGCRKCFLENKKSLVCGVGINDSYVGCTCEHGQHIISYSIWKAMLARCYSASHHKRYPTYSNCSVCKEWHLFSNFKKWFDENYIEGYHLDKDILVQDNKVYSPQTCVFIPPYLNTIIGDSRAKRGSYKQGVSWDKYHKKFVATTSIKKKNKFLGFFDDENTAFEVYKKYKYEEIKRVANDALSRGEINDKTYNALINYKIT